MKSHVIHIALFTVLLAAASSCASVSRTSEADAYRREKLYDYFFYEAANQDRTGNYSGAFDMLRYCLELNPESAPAKYMISKYYMLLGDRQAPEQLLLDCVEADPDNYWYWQMLAVHYTRMHEYRDAIDIYERMASRFPTRTDILSILMSLYDNAGEPRKGLSVLDRIEQIEGESLQFTVQRFQFYLQMNDMDSAYITIKPNAEWAVTTFYDMVTNINELNSIRDLCRRAIVDFPENLTYPLYLALSDYRTGETEQAFKDLDAGIARITSKSNAEDAAKLYTTRGDLAYYQKRMQECYDAYANALVLTPEDNMVANNYAYFLSLDGKELEKAEQLSRRTIEQEPLNATYLDTYAWILFGMSRYSEAKVYIDRAIQAEGEISADVVEHAGDIYYMTGDTDAALRFWHQAIELGSQSKEIERKIKENTPSNEE